MIRRASKMPSCAKPKTATPNGLMDLAIYHDSIKKTPLLLVELKQHLKNFPYHESMRQSYAILLAHVKQHPVKAIDNRQSHYHRRTVCPSIIEPYVAQQEKRQ